jgi:hypothetical protein
VYISTVLQKADQCDYAYPDQSNAKEAMLEKGKAWHMNSAHDGDGPTCEQLKKKQGVRAPQLRSKLRWLIAALAT